MPGYERAELKRRSKAQLQNASPNIYIVSLVFILLNALPAYIQQYGLMKRLLLSGGNIDSMYQIIQEWVYTGQSTGLQLAMLAMNVFLSVVTFGYLCYCLRVSRGAETGGAATLFSGFSQFWRVFSMYLLVGVFTFLWSLLLIIPGIVKACAYSQAPFIMLEHPEMSALECISESKKMMEGRKYDWFVLQLSFIGWEILSALTFGILNIWITPYRETANAGFYNGLVGWQPNEDGMSESDAETDRPNVDDYWKS